MALKFFEMHLQPEEARPLRLEVSPKSQKIRPATRNILLSASR